MSDILRNELHSALLNCRDRIYAETAYKPALFSKMLNSQPSDEVARKLVGRAAPSDGFVELAMIDRLDLSVEAVVINSRWTPLLGQQLQQLARHRLEQAGYPVPPEQRAVPLEIGSPVAAALRRILALQLEYSSQNTPAMQERGHLIRHVVPEWFRELLDPQASQQRTLRVEGSDGVGRKSVSPWVRIYDEALSPSATTGWYIVLHFSSDGSRAFLTLGCGATYFKSGSLVPLDPGLLNREIQWGVEALSRMGNVSDLRAPMQLGGNSLSDQYERATALCIPYTADALDEDQLRVDTLRLVKLLDGLYEARELGKGPTATDPIIETAKIEIDRTAGRRGKQAGQGRGLNAAQRGAVEKLAMRLAHKELVARGFRAIADRSTTFSFDYECEHDEGTWYVEVKGTTSTTGNTILLTTKERQFHQDNAGKTILVVVHDIELAGDVNSPVASGGAVKFLQPWDFSSWTFIPTGYEVRAPI